MQVIIEEKKKQVEIEEQEILRREKELESAVKKPAEAEKYRWTLSLCLKTENKPNLYRKTNNKCNNEIYKKLEIKFMTL